MGLITCHTDHKSSRSFLGSPISTCKLRVKATKSLLLAFFENADYNNPTSLHWLIDVSAIYVIKSILKPRSALQYNVANDCET